MAALTLDEVRTYLRVDTDSEDALLNSLMGAADEYIKDSVGESYDKESERVKTLALLVISDLYDNRGMSESVSSNVRKLIYDFSLQLRLGLRT